MFMMSKKKKKTISVIVAVVLAIGFLSSVVLGIFSTTGYTYSANYNLQSSNSAVQTAPVSTTAPGHSIPQQK